MIIFLIVLLALWIYPLLALALLKLTKNKLVARKRILSTSLALTSVAIIGLTTNISTTSSAIDWLIVSNIYLSLSLALNWTQFQPIKWLEIIGIVSMICTYLIGYLFSTVGLLGLAFALGEVIPSREKWLDDGVIYKETTFGNAISDYRGKRIEIYRTLSWLPLVEWKIKEKEYTKSVPPNPLIIDYNSTEKRLYLSAKSSGNRWADTLILGK